RPIEEALGVIAGLRRISSVSRAGLSDVILELAWDSEVSDATQDALERLDLVLLPDDAEKPLILHYDPSLDPVMELSLSSGEGGSGDRFAGEEGLRRLRRIAELQVKRALEPVKGVAAVRVRGGLEEEIHVLLDEAKLRSTGIAPAAVIERLRQENVNVAGGTLEEGRTEYLVRTLNEYRDLDQIGETIVASTDGRDVRIRDLGEVVRAHRDREIVTRADGAESVQVDVYKEAEANIVALAARVKEAIGELRERPPGGEEAAEERAAAGGRRGGRGPGGRAEDGAGLAQRLFDEEGVRLAVVADRSTFIEASIDEVKSAAILGGLLAILILFAFLANVRSTVIVGLAIPISLAVAFAPLHLLGVSLNIMSLGGLALGIGMLVDSSIVVLESIFRCREEGDDVETAAVRGTAEVRGAVTSSTLTTIAVFFPMVFVEGIAGQAFGDLGLAVVVSLLASLVVALVFVPMAASLRGLELAGGEEGARFRRLLRFASISGFARDFRRVRSVSRRWLWPVAVPWLLARLLLGLALELLFKLLLAAALAVAFLWSRLLSPALAAAARAIGPGVERAVEGLRSSYGRLARRSLARPWTVVAATAAILAATGWIFAGLDSELLPEVHQGEVTFEVALPVGTPVEETAAILGPVEEAIRAEVESIESLLVTFGFDAANTQRSDEGEHSARFKVLLADSDPEVERRVVAAIRERLRAVPDLESRVTRPVLFSSKTPIEVEVQGDDLARLKAMGERVRQELAALPELADVETTLRSGAPEVQIVYDRERLQRYGLNLRQVAEMVRNQVQGFEATRFNRQDRRIPIVVRLAAADRETVRDVEELVVNPGAERPIPLGAVARVTLGEGPSEVRRIDGQRVAVVGANLSSSGAARGAAAAAVSLGSAVDAIGERLAESIDWPADMAFSITGQNEEWERSRGSLVLALALSIFLVYVIMAAQFENLIHPLVILFTIPLAFFGTALLLGVLGVSLSVVVFLGMIMLAGIVVNNAIVLVDYINVLRRRGMGVVEAIVTAGKVRLRPILMTTATTVLGLLPMALGPLLGGSEGAEIRTPMALAVIGGLVTSTLLTLVAIPVLYFLFDRLQARLTGRPVEEPAAGAEDAAAGGERAGELGLAGYAREGAVES
ncbi:MAG TPA: efflux RND transporter permease subunit, partial [Thermoanaerobaculia bacterium]|nr:efflux RND transporter permease subunit [Thermoanaerobaculia bacterium]